MSFGSALITGASSGIGAALALALPGATGLLLTGRDGDRLAAVAIRAERPGRRVEILVADLATDAGRRAVIERAEAAGIDLLVNNAGLGRYGVFHENPPEIERAMVEVNVVAPVVLTRALLPGLIARARAANHRAGLVIVSSVVGFAAMPYMTTYAATKAFDLRFAEGLAEELKHEPVDVLALCPGSTETEFADRAGFAERRIAPNQVEAELVAAEALQALGRRRVHVVGIGNRAVTLAAKLLPSRLIALAAGRVLRPR